MKQYSQYFAIIITLLFLNNNLFAQIVSIPDANFKSVLVADISINTNQDNEIQVTEAQAYTNYLLVSSANIMDLTGIEAFTAITGLDCSYNQLTSLDLNANVALSYLNCQGNQINNLDIAMNTALTWMDCGANQLASLVTNNNTSLATLICNNNQLSTLDLTNNTSLTKILCSANQLNDLFVSTNLSLDTLICSYNSIGSLDLNNNSALKYLECQHNAIASINLGSIASLEEIFCFNNNDLATLDLSNCSALLRLEAYFCQFQSLDLSNSPALVAIACYNNQLEYLNVRNGNNLNIADFDAQNNPMLFCIMVDSVAYSNANWSFIDPASSFATFCTALNMEEVATEQFQIYPNPTQGFLNIHTNNHQQPTHYHIFNLQGQAILSGTYEERIDLVDFSEGLYWIQFYREETNLGSLKFRVMP